MQPQKNKHMSCRQTTFVSHLVASFSTNRLWPLAVFETSSAVEQLKGPVQRFYYFLSLMLLLLILEAEATSEIRGHCTKNLLLDTPNEFNDCHYSFVLKGSKLFMNTQANKEETIKAHNNSNIFYIKCFKQKLSLKKHIWSH